MWILINESYQNNSFYYSTASEQKEPKHSMFVNQVKSCFKLNFRMPSPDVTKFRPEIRPNRALV